MVERMRQGTDQGCRTAARQNRIGVQCDDVPNIAKLVHASKQPYIRCIDSSADEAVEFVQFATLAFQAHPFLLRRIPKASAMEEIKGRTGDLVVENLDCFLGVCQQRFIVLFCFCLLYTSRCV